MDAQIRRLAAAMLALFLLLFGAVNYVQVVAADRLVNNPANAKRLLIQEYEIDRGAILASDGRTTLARSVPSEGEFAFQREYPEGPLYAGITGFYSLVFGRSELELTQNDYLAGRDESLLPSALIDEILGRPKQGATVVTTIDPVLQQTAARALGNTPGAVAAIEPETGAVRALVANPTFDPSPLASHDPREIRAAWRRLNNDPDKPVVSAASDELFPPGSTFKMVTAAAALESGFGPDSRWPNPPTLDLPQTTNTLSNFGGAQCAGGAAQISLAQAFQESCNVTFAEIGLEVGAQRMAEQAARFGFSEDVPFDIPWAEGAFPDPRVFAEQQPQLAFSGIGQFDVRANPLQMALVAAAIANDGVLMRPRLVSELRDPQGRVLRSFGKEEWGESVSSRTAVALTDMMVSVVAAGTGGAARIPGVDVAGKTGTAQHARGEDPHAWFAGFAPAERPEIAVAVVVLEGGSLGSEATGGAVAAPIARQVIEAAL